MKVKRERLIQIKTQILCILFHAAELKNFVTRQHYTHSLLTPYLRKNNHQVNNNIVVEHKKDKISVKMEYFSIANT